MKEKESKMVARLKQAGLPENLALMCERALGQRNANAKFYIQHCGDLPENVAKADRPKCAARCRNGHACRATVAAGRRRCRLHGGYSTGPRTEAGRQAIRESNKRRARQKSA